MKKSLLALAVLGSFAGVAQAQSNVTVYGLLDVAVTRYKMAGEGSKILMEDGNDGNAHNGSRIGFKGTEDLGGGLSALFTIEGGFDQNTGRSTQGNRLFGRQAFVGLSSKSLGTVTLGRQNGILFEATGVVDPFDQGFVGNILGAFGTAGVLGFGFTGADLRVDNSIKYVSPSLSGLTASAMYSFGEQTDSTSRNSQYQLGVTYANGPLALTGAYLKAKPNNGGTATADDDLGNRKAYFVGGTYDLGVVKLAAAYTYGKEDGFGKDKTYTLGATVPVGANLAVFGSWNHKKVDDFGVDSFKADQVALGAQYALSKRTYAYTAVGYERVRTSPRANSNGIQVGLGHVF